MKIVYYTFSILSLLFLSNCKTVPSPIAAPPSLTSTKYVEAFGAKGDGKTDDTQAFKRAIQSIAKRKTINNGKSGGWGTGGAGLILLDGQKIYRITEPLIIPKEKNITFKSDAMGGAVIQYDGPGDFAIDFQFKGINAAIKIDGITFWKGGVRIQGFTTGRILIENNQFVDTPGPAIALVDAKDVGTHPTTFGVVHWLIQYNDFSYCNQGVRVVSGNGLLGTLFKNRFNFTVNTPLHIDANTITVDNNEFMGVRNRSKSYIHLSPNKNPVAHIQIHNNRFGPEIGTWNGHKYYPPQYYILMDQGKNGHKIANVYIEKNYFNTHRKYLDVPQSAEMAIYFKGRSLDVKVKENTFFEFQKAIINDVEKNTNCTFSKNKIYSKKPVFSRSSNNWKKKED
ncbi:MAG: hypothetical protein AAF985_05350 [Bacteroidota bacterium]